MFVYAQRGLFVSTFAALTGKLIASLFGCRRSFAEDGASSIGGTVPPRHPANRLSTVRVCYLNGVLDRIEKNGEEREENGLVGEYSITV